MNTSKSVIRGAGFLAGSLLVLLTACTSASVSTASLSQAASWPDPARIRGLKQQLAASEAKNGKDHPDLVEILLKLGNAYRDEGGYVPATPYVERALSITEKTHGSEHLEVAATLDKLGTLYLAQGDTARARTAYIRARPILLRDLGENNPGYGIFLMHVAELQLLTGENKEAEETVDQALTAFGEELSHAAHEWTEANRVMGLLFLGLGKYQEAEQQLVYALTVRSEAMSSETRDEALFYVASAKNSLGEFYVTVSRYDEAEPLLLDALSAYEKRYGKDHSLLEGVLVNLAALYDGRGDASKERRYAERAQALHRRSAGYSHLPDSAVWRLRRITPRPRPLQARAADATEVRLGAVTGAATIARDPVLLRMDAPAGRVVQYHTQTKSWLPGFDSALPSMVTTDVATESITAVDGDTRTLSTVVVSSHVDMPGTPQVGAEKDTLKGMTTVRRMDSRGRVLSSEMTRKGQGMDGPAAPHAASTFTLPEGPVRVGDTWTATETMPMGPGTGGKTATVKVTYRLERIGLKGDVPVAVISMNGAVTAWLSPAGLDRHLVASSTTPSGTMSGEIHLDLSAKWVVGLTMSMEDQWGTDRGFKTLMTTTAQ